MGSLIFSARRAEKNEETLLALSLAQSDRNLSNLNPCLVANVAADHPQVAARPEGDAPFQALDGKGTI